MNSLMQQSISDVEMHVVVDKDLRGAPWARNRGAEVARGKYLLFCDSDINWERDALEVMVRALEASVESEERTFRRGHRLVWRTAYAYGSYRQEMPDGSNRAIGADTWSHETLKRENFVSTMSLMVRELCPGWDESLHRLQDWDLFLRLAAAGFKGVQVGRVLFSTPYRHGITFSCNGMSFGESWGIVRRKHGLPV